MMKHFVELPKLTPGDQVAVVSPSAGLPGLFPWVQDLGLERLQSVFQLQPKEYPTTRHMGSSLEDRARDLHAAFTDPANKAVIASIGGIDQIRLLKLLDPEIFRQNPKPFFGYSDNTHLINFLWNLGVPAYYGGAIMTQYAMQGKGMHDLTVEFLKHALFDQGEYEIRASDVYSDENLDWSDKSNLTKERKLESNEGWVWDGAADCSGVLWGGCLESLMVQLAAGRYLPANEELDGAILYLETSEDLPAPWIVDYVISAMGERGWFNRFGAVLVGRPKAWDFGKQNSADQKAAYKKEQRQTVVNTVRHYNQTIPIVQNLDFGHTDPQIVVPSGNQARIVGSQQKIFFSY